MTKKRNIKSLIRSAIRNVWWLYSEDRRRAKGRAKVAFGRYQCECCSEIVRSKDIEIDHIEPIAKTDGIASWDDFIRDLFCSDTNLQAICKPCHKAKTAEENRARKIARQNKKL